MYSGKNKRTRDLIEIMEDVKIIYKCGKKDFFKAVHITEYGIITGRIAVEKKDDIHAIDSSSKKKKNLFSKMRTYL